VNRFSIDTLLAKLRNDLQADTAVFLRFGDYRGNIVLSDAHVDGDSLHWAHLCDKVAPAGFDHDSSDDALAMRNGQWCLQAPAQRHLNRFCWLDEDIGQFAPWSRSEAYQHLHVPNGFVEQHRAMLVNHGEVIGWVALLWKQAPRERSTLATKATNYLGDLQRVAYQIHDQPRTVHRFLLDARGEPLTQTKELASVFDIHALGEIRRRCQPSQDNMSETVSFFGDYALRAVPMQGDNERRATIITVEPLEPVKIDMCKALTSLQRHVAQLVAKGRSNKEAAEILDISVNTVKYHLQNIYSLVGVSNRVELAWFLSNRH